MQYPSVSTDQLAAFLELAKQGSLRKAAAALRLSEQGLRNRVLALEERLGAQLYRKQRGLRRTTALTELGRQFQPKAAAFLDQARLLLEPFELGFGVQEVHVLASQYLTYYVLIEVVRSFQRAFPKIRVQLSTRTEAEIEAGLLQDPNVSMGIAAPDEPASGLEYRHLFSMRWSLITPPGHRLLARKQIAFEDLASEPLICFEQGSTGRQHVMDAFRRRQLFPRIEMEVTNTQIMVRMVEAGLGVAIVPLLPTGEVTRGRRLGIRPLGTWITPIRSGILLRQGEILSAGAEQFGRFVQEKCRHYSGPASNE